MATIDLSIVDLIIGYVLNFVFALVIVRGIYAKSDQGKDTIFTFLAFNSVVYFVMTILADTELSVGVGFGLFAIFSLLRYRTSTVSTLEMTYLFILIALPVINSVLMASGNWMVVLITNGVMIVTLYALEQRWGFHYENSQSVKYDRIDWMKPEHHVQLLEDLRERTGLPIRRFTFGRVNLVEDTVEIKAHYYAAAVNEGPIGDEIDGLREMFYGEENPA
jgi:hypothetical protein